MRLIRFLAFAATIATVTVALPATAPADEARLYALRTKIDDLDISGADGALRSLKRGCEANREVALKHSASFGETDDWTVVATTRADRGGFWEIEQPLGMGAYQAVVAKKETSEYRCKRSFSDIEELFG